MLNWTLNLKNIVVTKDNEIKVFCYDWLDP